MLLLPDSFKKSETIIPANMLRCALVYFLGDSAIRSVDGSRSVKCIEGAAYTERAGWFHFLPVKEAHT